MRVSLKKMEPFRGWSHLRTRLESPRRAKARPQSSPPQSSRRRGIVLRWGPRGPRARRSPYSRASWARSTASRRWTRPRTTTSVRGSPQPTRRSARARAPACCGMRSRPRAAAPPACGGARALGLPRSLRPRRRAGRRGGPREVGGGERGRGCAVPAVQRGAAGAPHPDGEPACRPGPGGLRARREAPGGAGRRVRRAAGRPRGAQADRPPRAAVLPKRHGECRAAAEARRRWRWWLRRFRGATRGVHGRVHAVCRGRVYGLAPESRRVWRRPVRLPAWRDAPA